MIKFEVRDFDSSRLCDYCWDKKADESGFCCDVHKRTYAFVCKAKEAHGDKYDYSKVNYKTTKIKVEIVCKEHGSFWQRPNDHIGKPSKAGTECPKCVWRERRKKFTDTKKIFIKKALKIHGNKYDYSLVQYKHSQIKITIVCPIHGKFKQCPCTHLEGRGCRLCGFVIISKRRQKPLSYYINKAQTNHKNKYDYSKVKSGFKRIRDKVIIICPIHGEFKQTWNDHCRNMASGCPSCSHVTYSRSAIKWLENIATSEKIHIRHAQNGGEYKIPSTRYKVDGYCEETKTVYEFYGNYWHGNPNVFDSNYINPTRNVTMGDLYTETMKRENIIKNLGYNLITIWENDWNLNKNNL